MSMTTQRNVHRHADRVMDANGSSGSYRARRLMAAHRPIADITAILENRPRADHHFAVPAALDVAVHMTRATHQTFDRIGRQE